MRDLLDLDATFAKRPADAIAILCGPMRMLEAVTNVLAPLIFSWLVEVLSEATMSWVPTTTSAPLCTVKFPFPW